MAKPRDSGHSEGDATSPRRSHAASGHTPASVADAHEGVAQAANAGRPSELTTSPSGEPGGVPTGRPARIGPDQDDNVRRALERENSGAVILADKGYRVHQNPTPEQIALAREAVGDTGRVTARPDYLLDGRVFDCYSPKPDKRARGIWSEVGIKVQRGQTQRVIVNLEDWRGDMADLKRQFQDWPVEQLKEVKVITPDGAVIQIFPGPESD